MDKSTIDNLYDLGKMLSDKLSADVVFIACDGLQEFIDMPTKIWIDNKEYTKDNFFGKSKGMFYDNGDRARYYRWPQVMVYDADNSGSFTIKTYPENEDSVESILNI